MKVTTNYNLKKPDANTDLVNIEDLNGNFDIIDEKLFAVIQAWEDFKASGGEIGGAIKGVTGTTGHRFLEHTGVFNNRNALLRISTANMNGYPAIINMVEDLDNPDNGNGFVFVLGNGKSGDAYRNSFLRPVNSAYGAGTVNLGSPSFPWDDIFLRGVYKASNGYNRLSNGMILQWGEINLTGTSAQSSNEWPIFPISFPTQCLSIVGTASPRDGNTNPVACNFYIDKVDKNKYHYRVTGASASVSTNIQWMAIGY